ncbi:ArsR family transcriptional regulator [Salinibacter sp. 10B]|uniref:ArsR/SmtB family transcription factor n=1 Tax=Salinibacter sp. 10B TaxID=1923971 RepID=UPI000CF4C83E|nr:metalloregulator ArsR/SmtB family transcription factor [Salinibacter sp. 10B]PQJ26822.1 ArsR family transcriptional regulator [Salinibacter sp. 10B]
MEDKQKRAFKDEIYEQFARMGKAFSSASRLELIDLLAQRERTVDELAEETEMSVANTSRHLQVLKGERLVRRRKEGTRAYYTLADPEVYRAWKAVRSLAETRLAEVEETVKRYLSDRDEMEALSQEELEERLERDDVLVLDVRPEEEFEAGHIPGARSIPVDQLEEHLDELPEDRDIVAYCRGPYCVYSDDAVRKLQEKGRNARRLSEGLPDWLVEGRSVEHGG